MHTHSLVLPIPSHHPHPIEPLSPLLRRPGGLDEHGAVGALTAVHTTPRAWSRGQWLRLVAGDRRLSRDERVVFARDLTDLFRRVGDGLAGGEILCPPLDDIEATRAWARGYLHVVYAEPGVAPRGDGARERLWGLLVLAGGCREMPIASPGAQEIRAELPSLAHDLFVLAVKAVTAGPAPVPLS